MASKKATRAPVPVKPAGMTRAPSAAKATPAGSAQAPDAPKPKPRPAAARDAALIRRIEERDLAREVALVRRTLAAMAAIPDDSPGTDQAVMKAIDEERPGRPLFKGLY